MVLSVGVIPRLSGGADASTAGETAATTNFFLTGDFPGMTGSIASLSVDTGDETIELLAAPVTFQVNSNRTATLVAEAIRDGFETHGFEANSSYDNIYIKAPKGEGADANGWTLTVTPTGDVTTYDVKPFSGGKDKPTPSASVEYDILTTKPGAPFHMVFEFTGPRSGLDLGWRLVSLSEIVPAYPNGKPLYDANSRLLDLAGHPIVDEYMNRKYANGAVLGWDSGMLGMGLSAPPSTSSSFGRAGMLTWDATYLYGCIADNDWRRIPWETF
jgi:hypothetical protein